MMRFIAAVLAAVLWCGAAVASDCSSTITAGGTAQSVFTSGVSSILLQNNSANLMCFSVNGAAATIAGTNCGSGSYALTPGAAAVAGGMFTSPIGMKFNTLSVITSTTGDRFSCERQ